jgi:hypothetical protein
VFPHFSPSSLSGPAITGAAGQPIPCWGEKQFHLSFGGQAFTWPFLLATVQFPIIGVDFLRHFGLLVDPAANQLVDRQTLQVFKSSSVPAVMKSSSSVLCPPAHQLDESFLPSPSSSPSSVASMAPHVKVPSMSCGAVSQAATCGPSSEASNSFVANLLMEFPDVINAAKLLPAVKHDVVHHIQTSGPPIASRFRRLEGAKLEATHREFKAMEREGVIERSTSPWASPLHMVPKKDGTWRPCGDFRRLNLVTVPDLYPLPKMLDFADRLSGCRIFSKIDLRKGYWQVPVRLEDQKKTAIITPFGLFQFKRMPFGLRNADSSFQRMMDRVLVGLPFAYCYLDDLRIASPDLASHRQHLRLVFERLREFGLVINREKCVFAVGSLEFLGHQVSAEGARPLCSYVEAVEGSPPPSTIKELQTFLGLINFYRRFLPGAASIVKPLTDSLRGSKSAQEVLTWTPEMEASFKAAKASLSRATWLGHPDPTASLSLHMDASASHVGALFISSEGAVRTGSLWVSFPESWMRLR